MPSIVDKENASSGRLFSPSKYAVSNASSSMGGVFGRILEARNEAKTSQDCEVAARLKKKEEAEAKARMEREAAELEASRSLAMKLDLESKDEDLAHQISEKELEEMKRWKQSVAEIEAEDRKMVEKMLAEEERIHREIMERESKDTEAAVELQAAELKELEAFINDVAKKWKKPQIDCSNVEDGMLIAARLPHVKSLSVVINEEEKVINVKAVPDFEFVEHLSKQLPKELRPSGVDITLDLKIVGKESVSADEVKTRYDKEAGIAYIYVHNACLKTSKSGKFAARIKSAKSGLKRMFSRRSSLKE